MAILRALGGSPVTTRPPMSTSPAVGRSRPATVRSSVVLPQPDGPSSTRYSPSVVARSIPSRACTRPESKSLRRPRTSTTDMPPPPRRVSARSVGVAAVELAAGPADQPLGTPLLEDHGDLLLRVGDRLRRGGFPAGRPGEHRRDHERAEHLADRGVRRTRMADVRAPVGRLGQEGQLVPAGAEAGHLAGKSYSLDAQVADAKFAV